MAKKPPAPPLSENERQLVALAEDVTAATYGFNHVFWTRRTGERVRGLLAEIEADHGINQSTAAVLEALRSRLGGKRQWDVPVGRLPDQVPGFVRVNERGQEFGKRSRPRDEFVEGAIEAALVLLAYTITQTGVLFQKEEAQRHPRSLAANKLRYGTEARSFAEMQRAFHEAGHPQSGFEELEARASVQIDEARRLLRDPEARAKGGRPAKRPRAEVLSEFLRSVREEWRRCRPTKLWGDSKRIDFALKLKERLSAVVGTQRPPALTAIQTSVWREDRRPRSQAAAEAQLLSVWYRCDARTARNWEKTTG